MPEGKPFPRRVVQYFSGEIPFGHLDRTERELVREYERDRKRRYRARKKRLVRQVALPRTTEMSTYHS